MKTIRKHFGQKIEIRLFLDTLQNCSLNLINKESAYPIRAIGDKDPIRYSIRSEIKNEFQNFNTEAKLHFAYTSKKKMTDNATGKN